MPQRDKCIYVKYAQKSERNEDKMDMKIVQNNYIHLNRCVYEILPHRLPLNISNLNKQFYFSLSPQVTAVTMIFWRTKRLTYLRAWSQLT